MHTRAWLDHRSPLSPNTTFETFPFPKGLTSADTAGPVETLDNGIFLPAVARERRSVRTARSHSPRPAFCSLPAPRLA